MRKSKITNAPIVWSNTQWVVTSDGYLEAEDHHYTINGRAFFGSEANELALWPMHMARKRWIDIEALIEAAMHLSERFDIKPNYDTADIFRKARLLAAKTKGNESKEGGLLHLGESHGKQVLADILARDAAGWGDASHT